MNSLISKDVFFGNKTLIIKTLNVGWHFYRTNIVLILLRFIIFVYYEVKRKTSHHWRRCEQR